MKANKLLEKDQAKVKIDKKEKKIMQYRMSPYIKVEKANQ